MASAALAGSSVLLTPGTADAAVYVIDAPMFGIGIDDADDVTIDCDAGKVRVYDDGVPTTYTTNCNAVTALGVTAVGAFDNTIDVSAMTTAAFPLATTGLVGGEGNDSILGGQKSDAIQGRQGNDTLAGGGGTDLVAETADANLTLTDTGLTGIGTDILSGFELGWLTGGPSPNTLDASGFTGPVTIEGLGGNDTLLPGSADSTLSGGDGSDLAQFRFSIDLGGGSADWQEESSSLMIAGVLGFLATLGGIERVDLTGNELANKLDLSGFPGDVTLQGMGGDDTITGGEGIDLLDGGDGQDELQKLITENMLITGTSVVIGGAGPDSAIYEIQTEELHDTETDVLADGTEIGVIDIIPAGKAIHHSLLERISFRSGAGDDTVRVLTFPGPVEMRLGGGDDVAKGGKKRDKLLGQDGKDTLNGGRGSDTMKGGDGNDEHLAKDGRQDTVKCGRGRDIVIVDLRDRVAGDCELVGFRPRPPNPPSP